MKQRELCQELGLSERLIEDIVSVASEPGLPCPDCEQSPCKCGPFESTDDPTTAVSDRQKEREAEAEQEKKLQNKMDDLVQQDMGRKYNPRTDKITLYPTTDAPV